MASPYNASTSRDVSASASPEPEKFTPKNKHLMTPYEAQKLQVRQTSWYDSSRKWLDGVEAVSASLISDMYLVGRTQQTNAMQRLPYDFLFIARKINGQTG